MITRRTVAETDETAIDFTVEQALELADEWALSGELPAPLIVSLAWHVLRLQAIEQRAREVVGTRQPEDTKSLAARGRTRVNLARWILDGSS
jgi:hypothetical protein